MRDRHLHRLERAARAAAERGLAAVLVGPSPDLAYLTGYEPMPLERPTLLVVRPDASPRLLVPALEAPAARSAPLGGDLELLAWRDGEDPYAAAARLVAPAGTLAVDDRLWAAHLLGLQRALPAARFVPASGVLGGLRAVKDPEELDRLRRAAAAADATFEAICASGLAGRRELDVAAELAELLVANGHARAAFTIVAAGPNGASPHHEPTERTIRTGDAVVLDFGGALEGYHSDITRTVVVERAPEGFAAVYELVREAQEAAVAAVAPGVPIAEVDRAAREPIERAGFGERFLHRTGHGIGLEVHEPPYAVAGDPTVLAPGMTFSVEPGIYLDGRFGVRIEDIVAVTPDGVERLNRADRALRTVG
ncbi:MAG: dipeptidase [Actinomycetota bacterium]|nr:MAG: dipeptidase [Actinomycetota bacterium]